MRERMCPDEEQVITAALVGSSGVGKSSLVNALRPREALRSRFENATANTQSPQAVGSIRQRDQRGAHTTSHRELFVLAGGGLILDTPGLRELSLTADADAVSDAFEEVEALSMQCRFRDCGHQGEPGCAVAEAIESGALSPERLRNRAKLHREQRRFDTRRDAHARHEERERGKRFARMVKQRTKPPR